MITSPLYAMGEPEFSCKPLPLEISEAMTRYTNIQRQVVGLGLVSQDERLSRIAHDHSCDMLLSGYFSHQGKDGSRIETRTMRGGYDLCFVAENIAMGQRNAAHVFLGWMRSPGHRKNILSPHVRHVGFGASTAKGFRGGAKWVMILASECR